VFLGGNMRKFEKISFDQFKKDIEDNIDLYEKYKLPSRATKLSAGYDFYSLYDFTLKPNEIIKIPTGIKASMNNDEVLMLFVRSSQGFKYNVRLCNQVGILDGDYYNNESNEGHIWIKIQNQGNKDYFAKSGEAICQGIFTKYLTVDNEEKIKNERKGGFGSTSGEK
jgi:deoxyuridine 5'triphosphate nucleotidohydrolase dUTPase